MIDLIASLAAAEAGSRALDWAIDETINGKVWEKRHYTTIIDAALTLVPDNGWWSIQQFAGAQGSGKSGYHARITTPEDELAGHGIHQSAAIAVCLAALRARLPR